MGAAGGVPAAPEGLRSTAGGLGKLSTFSPDWSSGMGDFAPLTLRAAPKLGEGQQTKLEEQRALADKLRDHSDEMYRKARTEATQEDWADYKASPVEFNYEGGNLGWTDPQAPGPKTMDKSPWHDRTWDFSGVDKGWEDYDAEWQKSMDPSNFSPGSPEWQQALSMQGLRNAGVDMLHSISGDPRDPIGYGSDYGKYYDLAHGAGSLQREANRYGALFAADDPSVRGMQDKYGYIDWDDPNSVEAVFRNMNYGGTMTAGQQDRIAQNARTDLTEGAIMSAMMMGMGALAAPATIGYGGTYGASNALGSTIANQFTADALARQAISGMGQYSG